MNKIFIGLLFLLVCLTNNNVIPQGRIDAIVGLKFIISTDKKNYIEGEMVWEEFKLIIDKSVTLDYKPTFCLTADIQEVLKNSSNINMPYSGLYYDAMSHSKEYPDTLYDFEPSYFGIFENVPKSMYLPAFYLPADEYEFLAYVNVSIKGKIYKVEAEPFKFTVYKPEGSEINARQEYLEIIPLVIDDAPDSKLISDKFESFINKYPNSVYVDQVLRKTKYNYFTYKFKSVDEVIEFQLRQISRYPFFASNYERIGSIMGYYEIKKDSIGFLNLIDNLEENNKNVEILNKVLFYIKRNFDRELKQNKFN